MTDDLRLVPGVGVPPLEFGMTPEAVRQLLGDPPTIERRERVGRETWFFDDGLNVVFDQGERLDEIEIVRRPGRRLMFGSTNLLGGSGLTATKALTAAAADAAPDEHGFEFDVSSLGIYLWREDNDHSRWDSVAVCMPGERTAIVEALAADFRAGTVTAESTPEWPLTEDHCGPLHAGMDRDLADQVLGTPDMVFVRDGQARVSYPHVLVVFGPDGLVDHAGFAGTRVAHLVIADTALQSPIADVITALRSAGHRVEERDSYVWVEDGVRITPSLDGSEITAIEVFLRRGE